MSEIKQGDLVIVTGSCCDDSNLGTIHEVLEVSSGQLKCSGCGSKDHGLFARLEDLGGGHYWSLPFSWLRKIEPLPKEIGQHDEIYA